MTTKPDPLHALLEMPGQRPLSRGAGLFKIQAPHCGQIQQAHAAIQALRKAQTVGNRRTHVGLPQLSHDRTVYVLDHGVNHALRMHYHINLINRH